MPKTGVRRIATMVKVSSDTFNKMHYLKQPFETHDETLNRILADYPEMQKKINVLEGIVLERNTKPHG